MSLRTYCCRNEKEKFGAVLLVFLLAFSCTVLLQAPIFCSNPGCSSAQPGRLWSQELGVCTLDSWWWWEMRGILQECGRCPCSGALVRSWHDELFVQLIGSILRNIDEEHAIKLRRRRSTWQGWKLRVHWIDQFVKSLSQHSGEVAVGSLCSWSFFSFVPIFPAGRSCSWVDALRIILCAGGLAALGCVSTCKCFEFELDTVKNLRSCKNTTDLCYSPGITLLKWWHCHWKVVH